MTDPLTLAARLVWGSVRGPRLTDDDRVLLATGLAGVVLFRRNVRDPGQVAELVAEIRAAAGGPIRIAVDQEGGHVVRLAEPLTPLPSPMAIGATADASLAYRVARASALELAALGIDVVLAPVLDVAADLRSAVVGARAFGDEPSLVARLGAAAIRGYLDGGVLPVPKHFPGHGRTPEDTHYTVPRIDGSASELETVDLPPFRAAVAAGAPALMTSHVVHAAIDGARPVSLSPRATALARHDLGFEGLLVTDAIVMDAIAHRRRLDLAPVDAVVAGADVVMAIEATWRCLGGLEAAIRDDRIPRERLAEAVAHADAFDAAADALRFAPPSLAALARHARLAATVAARSLTLVADAGLLPVTPQDRVLVVDIASAVPSPIEEALPERPLDLGGAVGAVVPDTTVVRIDPRTAAGLDRALEAAASADRIVLGTRDAFAHAGARLVVSALPPERTIHVALRSPADLELGDAATRIAAYADIGPTAGAIAAALLAGPGAFPGRLPVTLAAGTAEVAA